MKYTKGTKKILRKREKFRIKMYRTSFYLKSFFYFSFRVFRVFRGFTL